MSDVPIAEHVFAVVALGGVGLWTIFVLGRAGFSPRGVPGLPARVGAGRAGRAAGVALILIGSAFLVLAAVAAVQLAKRLGGGS
jgi:hypothetical protein